MSKRVLCGTVVSNKSDKTIVVSVLSVIRDSLYKKFIKRYKKYSVHHPYIGESHNFYKRGDCVKIQECRPVSSTKRWVVFKEKI